MIALVVLGVLGVAGAVAFVVAPRGSVGDDVAPDVSPLDENPAIDENPAVDGNPAIDENPELDAGPVADEPVSDDQVPVSDESPDVEDQEAVDAPAAGNVALDVSTCSFVDDFTLAFDLTNSGSKQSSYIIDVVYRDDAGQQIGDEPFFVNYIRPGERTLEGVIGSVPDDAAMCEIVAVERIAAESPDDTAEATCAVTGLDPAGDISTELVVMNGSGDVADYLIDFALIRDGTRVGSGFASLDDVQPGESAPSEGSSSTNGPVEGVTCEVVHLSRIAS
ncbi:MAG: hypothetical protein WA964_12900 [Ilumatobacter sp.]|uniref:hypothetical protein n=1 Tax=Ilumatobacter sp. TaxID=1967498 RepID=UPI003C737443